MNSLLHSRAAVSARQFALFRIIFGAYLAWHYTALVPWGAELFSAAGILGEPGANPFHGRWWNPLFDPAAAPLATIFPAIAGILSVLLACGIGRRLVALALAVIHSMLFTACPLIANPGLPYVGLLLWLCAIIPSGETWSGSNRDWRIPGMAFLTANFLLAAGYTFSGVSKLTSPGWLDGTALNTVLQGALARGNGVPELLTALPDEMLSLMTWGALVFEIAYLPLWVFSRFRTSLWLAAIFFHIGILFSLDFADLTLSMFMIHLFVMPAWLRDPLKGESIAGPRQIPRGIDTAANICPVDSFSFVHHRPTHRIQP
jgi:Vitamin K-dependent gamma-carboxylase